MIFTGAEQSSSFWNGLILLLLLQKTTNITWHYQHFSMSLKLSMYSVFGRVSNFFIFFLFFFGWIHRDALCSLTEKQNLKSGTIKKEKTNKQTHFRNIRISNMFLLTTSLQWCTFRKQSLTSSLYKPSLLLSYKWGWHRE